MKRFLAALIATLLVSVASAQPKDFVTWTYSMKKLSADEYELRFHAKIESPWHMYSQIKVVDKDGDGPAPLEFEFKKSSDYKLLGKTIEPTPIEHPEPMYDGLRGDPRFQEILEQVRSSGTK